jgi:hypothetical protein
MQNVGPWAGVRALILHHALDHGLDLLLSNGTNLFLI